MQLVRESRGTGVQIRLPLAPESPAAGPAGRCAAGFGLAGCRPLGMTRRRRGVLMLGLAAVCAGLAASLVDRYANDVSAQVGPLQPVVVARRDVPRGTLVTPAVARTVLAAATGTAALCAAAVAAARRGEALGYRTLGVARRRRLRGRGAARHATGRSASQRSDRAGALSRWRSPGQGRSHLRCAPARSSTCSSRPTATAARPRTYLALQRLELVDFRDSSGAEARDGADATATVRTTLRQAVTLIAAQNFAREVRVVPRPGGDVRRLGPTSVTRVRARTMSAIEDLAQGLRRRLIDDARDGAPQLQSDPEALRGRIAELLREQARPLEEPEREALIERLLATTMGLGPLEPLMEDPEVDEIMVNGHGSVLVERAGQIQPTAASFESDEALLHVIERILSPLGRRVDEAAPLADARLPDGSRVNCVIPPLSLDGPLLTIRRFRTPGVRAGRARRERDRSPKTRCSFLRESVLARRNIVVSGGTGSGKTTLLNVLSSFVGRGERVITIEDAAELRLRQPHVLRLESRPAESGGWGRGHDPASGAQRASDASRPDHRRRGARRGGARHAPGAQHRTRRVDDDGARELRGRRAAAHRDACADGRRRAAARRGPPAGRECDRPRRASGARPRRSAHRGRDRRGRQVCVRGRRAAAVLGGRRRAAPGRGRQRSPDDRDGARRCGRGAARGRHVLALPRPGELPFRCDVSSRGWVAELRGSVDTLRDLGSVRAPAAPRRARGGFVWRRPGAARSPARALLGMRGAVLCASRGHMARSADRRGAAPALRAPPGRGRRRGRAGDRRRDIRGGVAAHLRGCGRAPR